MTAFIITMVVLQFLGAVFHYYKAGDAWGEESTAEFLTACIKVGIGIWGLYLLLN